MEKYCLVIAGVGGQGGLTLSRVVATAAVLSGLSARTGETLGMSQRGGSVQSYVKIGRRVRNPLIMRGSADALIGLEPLEAVRASHYVGPRSKVVVDPDPVPTIFNLVGKEEPKKVEELLGMLREKTENVYLVQARREAEKMGSRASANMILLGKLISLEEFLPREKVEQAIREVLRDRAPKAIEAFRRGMQL